MSDLDILDTIIADVDKYTGAAGHHMPRYESQPYPQRLSDLTEILETHMLREIGDIKRYLDLQEKIIGLGGVIPPAYPMMQWLDKQMGAIKPVTPEKDVLVISLLAYGREYVDKMLAYTFKSLMAFENLPCLAVEKRVVIYIQTDESGKCRIEDSPITGAIKALGVKFDYAIIPDEIIKSLKEPNDAYRLLGACASLGIHYAKALGAAFHHSFPDMVYSNKFFSELLRLSKQHKSILCSGMRSDETLMIPALTPYMTDTLLSISSDDLLSHHLNSIHLSAWPYIVNNRPQLWTYPQFHVLIWKSPNYVYINSPHHNALWLDYSVIKDLPSRVYWTLDSEMDLICKGDDFYVVQESDEMYQAELSPPDRAQSADKYTDPTIFAKCLWMTLGERDRMKFFLKPQITKLNPAIRISNVVAQMSDKQIGLESDFLFNTLMSTDPYKGGKSQVSRTHAGRIYG